MHPDVPVGRSAEGPVDVALEPDPGAAARSGSVASKPIRSRSKRSSLSQASSSASNSSLQPARRASWLSAIRYARFSAPLRCSNRITGSSASPSFLAASSRPWPARMPAFSSIRINCPAKLHHWRHDLVDLRLPGHARLALVRSESVDRPELDPVGERDQGAKAVMPCWARNAPGSRATGGTSRRSDGSPHAWEGVPCQILGSASG